jgi:hypothetical protein
VIDEVEVDSEEVIEDVEGEVAVDVDVVTSKNDPNNYPVKFF